MIRPLYDDKLALLKSAFKAGLEAVMPSVFMQPVAQTIRAKAQGRAVHILAVGKAAQSMVSAYLSAKGPAQSILVIAPHNVPDVNLSASHDAITLIQSAHPVPDQQSEVAARAALSLATSMGADDLFVVLLSGGGSSLMSLGLAGVSLADKQAVNQALLDSGLAIQQVNIVRKHLSAVKGGRLAQTAFPAELMSFALSDVPDDSPSAIASGPTVGDISTRQMAQAILADNQISVPAHLHDILADERCETPAPDAPMLARTSYEVVASSQLALAASARHLAAHGYDCVILPDQYQLDTTALADEMAQRLGDLPAGTALISGGEASVRVTGDGIGGRNAQFALEMARRNLPDICGLSCDTDGIDGARDTAGAVFYAGLRDDAKARAIDIEAHYKRFDSHPFFEKMSCDVITGPTQTNVNDLRIILKGMPS